MLLDNDDRKIMDAVAYRDDRTAGIDKKVYEVISEDELYARTGIQKQNFNTIYQLMAVKSQEPDAFEKAKSMLMIPDYLNFLLTGEKVQEYTNATTTQLVNPVTKDWDYELIDRLGYPKDIFGEIKNPGSEVGKLRSEVSRKVGFDCKVILPATHDTASAVMAVPTQKDDTLYISSGTWSLMGTELVSADCSSLSMEHNLTNEGGYDYRFRYLKNIMGLWMIQSVRKQTYANWELCIANANPDNEEVKQILEICTKKDDRIKVVNVPENEGIAQNTNCALDIATGEFIGLLDHDDLLEENALYEIVSCLNKKKETDVLYTDEDKVTTDLDEYFSPNFKPDFNLDMLRANNYICHFFVAKKELIKKVGGFRAEYNGAQDYDLILRCTEQAQNVAHIAKILYHWRVHKESTADNPLSKMYAYEAGKKAIEGHLARSHTDGEVLQTDNLGFYRVKYPVKGKPLVSILIPNKDQVDTLDKCLRSIEERTDYDNYEIIIIENNSTEQKTFDYYNQICNDKIRVVYWKKEFNYSAINNFGVDQAKGEYLLLLNNDMEVISRDWMSELLGLLSETGGR